MEKNDESELSPKVKQKKSLCKFLLARKGVINNRVGCLHGGESLHDGEMSPGSVSSSELRHPEEQSARLGLCCAVTDVTRSPAVTNLTRSPSGVSSRPLDIPIVSSASSSPIKSNGFPKFNSNYIDESPSPTNNNNEPESKERARLRNRVLIQRRSADNLFPNVSPASPLRTSSPESAHSAPTSKIRSTSHDTMLCNSSAASMDSLARQALLAAQVLHLIPTTKARERNFLQGRIAATSLLGATELERTIPNREVKIFVGTWNMNGQSPPKELNDFVLPGSLDHVPDILAIGTQESCSERFEWEVCLQETIGPSHVMLHSTSLGTLHLAIFVRRDLIWHCSICEDSHLSVRPGTAFRTKGAIAIAFMLFGTSYLFVTAHLTAHQEKVKERVSDVKRIVRALDLPKHLPIKHKNKDVTQNFDCVFWCGDLNFRLNEPRAQILHWIDTTNFPLPAHLPHGMLHTDQLQAILAEGAAFKGFREAQITFPPTYKYDPGTQKFDSSNKQRAPAYTDRILFKSKGLPTARRGSLQSIMGGGGHSTGESGVSLECLIYDSVPSIVTSDHKPVWGVFKCSVRPGIDTIPLAAGLFNREVYLEGIRRRAATLDKERGASTICSVQ